MSKVASSKLTLFGILVCIAVIGSLAWSHCQVPCGIYGDEGRFETIAEHVKTIAKSMKQIDELSEEPRPNTNQIVRWVNNKEQHADEIAEIVTYYFMAQRIKLPPAGDAKAKASYLKKLTLLHEMLVYSMKAKQSTDTANTDKLETLLAEFHEVYYAKTK